MNMISLSSITADSDGSIVFDTLPSSEIKETSRRVSRTKTLDGGCVITDSGFSDSDRTLSVNAEYSSDVATILNHLHQDKTLIHIAVDEDFFSGVISSLKIKDNIKIQILIKEKLSE